MKRLAALALTLLLALSFTACGDKHDYSTDFTGLLNITSFEMTEEDAITLENGADHTTDDSDDSRLLRFDNGHLYRFSAKDGAFEFAKWTVPNALAEDSLDVWEAAVDEVLADWRSTYGEPAVNEDLDTYTWYGNINGEKANLVITRGVKGGKSYLTPSLLELDKVK